MDINDLKLFARAAELGNITHAAAELDYTQSAPACGFAVSHLSHH